jgi:hypothetical protein
MKSIDKYKFQTREPVVRFEDDRSSGNAVGDRYLVARQTGQAFDEVDMFAMERVTNYDRDGRNLVRRETLYPSWPTTSPSLVTSSTYDPNGNPLAVVDPLGQTTTSA